MESSLDAAERALKALQDVTAAAREAIRPKGEDEADAPDNIPHAVGKRRKVALFLAYNGEGYSGMQLNPGVPTIEGTLMGAIHKAGGTPEVKEGESVKKLVWMRAARTDKGVSAVGQVVSLSMHVEPEGMVDRINARLPAQIRVFGFKRVRKSFDARQACDCRRYEYSLPEWAFDPDLFPARPGWRPAASAPDAAVLTPDAADPQQEAVAVDVGGHTLRLRRGYAAAAPPTCSSFVFDDECRARLNAVLAEYTGTHNFHNFSPAVQAPQAAARRHILSFACTGVFAIGAARWVRMEVVGQSFLLNQIRKMVGLALAVYRRTAPRDALHTALDPNRDFTTPMAPPLGLLLAEARFEVYNRMYGHDRELLSLGEWADAVERFKQEHLYPQVAERDRRELVNYRWLAELTDERYLFSKWQYARELRNEKRPRSKEEREAADAKYRARQARIDVLVAGGLSRAEALKCVRREEAAANQAEADAGPAAKRAKAEASAEAGGAGAEGEGAVAEVAKEATAQLCATGGRDGAATSYDRPEPDDEAGAGGAADDAG